MTELVTTYKGAKIQHVFRGDSISVTCAVDKTGKLEYHGPVCVDHLTNSYRYGEEVHLIAYQAEEPRYVLRQADSREWIRVEAHFSVDQFTELAKAWLRHEGFEVSGP